MLTRRRFLTSATAAAALAALGIAPETIAAGRIKTGPAERFSFDALIARARDMAKTPYNPHNKVPRDILDRIDYEAHGKIRFNTDYALFANGPGQFPLTFFHLGKFFPAPVHMYVLDGSGSAPTRAREILYDDNYFDMPADSPAHQLPAGSGFAGFRFQESRLADQQEKDWRKNDWVAFLGASYFRAIGDLYQYGLSARGIAIDVAEADRKEEFPDFTHFFFEPSAPGSDTVVAYALLEGPSVTGAYKFTMRRAQGVTMEIDKSLFLRRDVARLGLAPATSMYWFSETVKGAGVDWRPEVHDSDGLAIWNGNGEHIWRPLNNPPRTMASSFADSGLRGFGLSQRDRDFDHYQDGVMYQRRPSLWVEPLDNWGDGAVQLIEIKTDDEIHDNIVAMWVPKAAATAGSSYRLRYRLYWQKDEPFPSPLARCVATRLGNGGQPGQPRPSNVRKFMVEFQGAPLEKLPFGARPEVVLGASRGSFSYVFAEPVPDGVAGHWRAQFDLAVDGDEPVDMRLFLRDKGQALTETWLFQYHPFKTSPVYG
ncbi:MULTISPECIES: glucan biosynthesis protein [unclassified Herbaspirillum]|uniref:glucan biosynthesis protein n=1 Tax=unclassified Herbaspirillum TaxID=2624150 RepID=UPI00114FE4BA|nr:MULTISPECIES: glucan biosynthesis protein D [unclassified Herbaspirillum]MBB5392276.1 glucans biosynthesis protein [Herbaspirillum sp. SJZ102]TQK05918.1 glucans biosynthesis protein [Herbaspirillum sp. SJZ130]TQK12604.1 glucans biosynthesis protein [Herbaspirillum sp. SJZ106]TWC68138.1 glucans biosynthesis protein [Herbaspirillum sp. SJZ099]